MRLSGKTALVTGGNSGIGRGIVHRFVKEGACLAFAGPDSNKAEQVAAEIADLGGEAIFLAADLSRSNLFHLDSRSAAAKKIRHCCNRQHILHRRCARQLGSLLCG